jgi:mannosyltransferase
VELNNQSSASHAGSWARPELIALAALLMTGAALRIHGLTDHGLWIDEYGTWWAIAGPTWSDCWDRVLAIHGQSPLYYLLVRLSTETLGVGTASLRLPSLLAGLGLLALAYPLAMRLFGSRRVSLLCVVVFAVNPHLIYHSQEARPYAVALLLAAASFYYTAAAINRGSVADHVAAVVVSSLAFYAHYLFGILMLAQAAVLLLEPPQTTQAWRRWIAHAVALGVLAIPGLLQMRNLFSRREALDWMPDPSPWAGLETAWNLLDPVAVGALGASVAMGLVVGRFDKPPARGQIAIPLLWLTIPILVIGFAAPLAGIHLTHDRYLVMVVPAIPLLMGWLLSLPAADSRWRMAPVAIFLVIMVALRLVPQVSRSGGPFWWFYHQDWEGAVSKIAADYRDGDVILYRTGFVELDAVLHGTASTETREFAQWPVLAHLPAGRSFKRVALPYSTTSDEMNVLVRRLSKLHAKRVWLIGLDPVNRTGTSFRNLEEMVRRGAPMQTLASENYGLVRLNLMR